MSIFSNSRIEESIRWHELNYWNILVMTCQKYCTREGTTQFLYRSVALCFTDLLISLFQRVGFQTLPWQTASQEVQEHVTKCFHVITPTLLCENKQQRWYWWHEPVIFSYSPRNGIQKFYNCSMSESSYRYQHCQSVIILNSLYFVHDQQCLFTSIFHS